MKFLVPTDFSDNAFHAAVYAVTLAKAKPGSSIHLLHVLTPVINDPVLIGDIVEEAVKSLEKIKVELKSRCSSCSISHSVKIGDTVSEIIKKANELNSGVVVMGIQGLDKTRRFFFGSNSRSLVDKATCPVLVIPETSVLKAPQKIVFATDYYDSDLEALQRLVPIAAAFNSEIVMVHIFDECDEEQSELIMMNFISNEIFKTIDYPHITYRVYYNERTSEGLKSFSESTGADLVVLSARKQNVFQKLFTKSVTKELAYNSGVPLLIFHVHKTGDPAFL
jgi:nucleotide-binding universal stress UspA family protein